MSCICALSGLLQGLDLDDAGFSVVPCLFGEHFHIHVWYTQVYSCKVTTNCHIDSHLPGCADHQLPPGVGRAPRTEAEARHVDAEQLLREEQESASVLASDAYAAQLEARHKQ